MLNARTPLINDTASQVAVLFTEYLNFYGALVLNSVDDSAIILGLAGSCRVDLLRFGDHDLFCFRRRKQIFCYNNVTLLFFLMDIYIYSFGI